MTQRHADTFFWHDYETSGRDPRIDRPVQFAGVRTDLELNEIEPPVNWLAQPAPDVLPDPQSVLITGIVPQRAAQSGMVEAELAQRIEAELARPGTIGVGYNSIRFDDEFTRFLLWRNLFDPYSREWRHGCSRWDLQDVVRCCWSLRPEGLQWPRYHEGDLAGRPSFRLEDLARANGLVHEAAHDALSDVRATIALARLIRSKQPRLWEFCLKLRTKDGAREQMPLERPFVHLSGRYPVERGFLALVWPLAPHPSNRNELIVWDLAADPSELERLDAATVRQRLFTRADALPEGVQRLPIKTIHLNKSPIVIANLKVLGDAPQRWGLDVEAAMRHAEVAARMPRLDALWAEVFGREQSPGVAPPDVDADLYGGFVPDADRRLLEKLRVMSGEQLADALSRRAPAFEDERLEELLFRYRARSFPHTLTVEEQQRWQAHCQARLLAGGPGRLGLAAYFERLDELAEAAAEREDERAQALLEALHDHAQALAPD
jgi:exodeoxyribonuclease I